MGMAQTENARNQILPVPSEVGHYQCEEKCHLIAVSSSFRPSGRRSGPEFRLERNHG
jgi:hypothetical protein